jgi:hypothetical protein
MKTGSGLFAKMAGTFFLIFSALLTGCNSVGSYFRDRALDFTDIVDVKYGAGLTNLGFGAKVEVFSYVGTGLGYGNEHQVTEWYGRKAGQYPGTFAQAVLLGMENPGEMGPNRYGCWSLLLCQAQHFPKERYASCIVRTGPEVLLPFIRFGIYLNAIELADFLTGWFGIDLTGDDGEPKEVDRGVPPPFEGP